MTMQYPFAAHTFWQNAWKQAAQKSDRTASDISEERFWQGHAENYDETSPLAELADELVCDVLKLLEPFDKVIEIGPGTGAFTKRIFPHIGSWLGVEPSASMRDVFNRLWPSTYGPLPALVPSKWENAELVAADVVFAANAFYRIRDMRACLERITHAARRRAILVQTIGRPHASPLVVREGATVYEGERAFVIAAILTEMGIEHRLRTYQVQRSDGPSSVALIDWLVSAQPR